MEQRFWLCRRENGVYFSLDKETGRRKSLKTKDRKLAARMISAQNESHHQPALNLELAKIYLSASDTALVNRTWTDVFTEIVKFKKSATKERLERAVKDKAFDLIRDLKVIETNSDHFMAVLTRGGVSTNAFLRKIHNFALDMDWIPKAVIPKKKWPKIEYKAKRAITWDEHQRIIQAEQNPEKRAFYELAWHFGAGQSDLANLARDDIDWNTRTVSFRRKKTGTPVNISFGTEAEAILVNLPNEGKLFPHLSVLQEKDRADAFRKSCQRVEVSGVTLHSYRYAWAQRAKVAGYPERWAQAALGHNTKAVHEAYARAAKVVCPSLEEYEKKVIPMGISEYRI